MIESWAVTYQVIEYYFKQVADWKALLFVGRTAEARKRQEQQQPPSRTEEDLSAYINSIVK